MNDEERQDEAVRELYRRGRDDKPSADLDRRIIAAAASHTQKQNRRWWRPISVAAVVVLGATVALQVFEQVPDAPLPVAQEESERSLGDNDGIESEGRLAGAPAGDRAAVPAPPRAAGDSLLEPTTEFRSDLSSPPSVASKAETEHSGAIGAREAVAGIRLPANLLRLQLLLPETPTQSNLAQALPGAQIRLTGAGFQVSRDGLDAMSIETDSNGRLVRAQVYAASLYWLPGLPFGETREVLTPDCALANCELTPSFRYRYRREPVTGDWILHAVDYAPR